MSITHAVITRPQPQAGQLAKLCAAAGMEPIVMPAFSFEALAPDVDPEGIWQSPQGPRLAVFTSPRSVHYALDWAPEGFLDAAVLVAIGPATARALTNSGHSPGIVPPAVYSSEALLTHTALDNAPGEAVIFAAPDGRKTLQYGLEAKGWRVSVLEVYRRVMLPPDNSHAAAVAAAGAPVSVWTSASAMASFSNTLAKEAWHTLCKRPMLVISGRLAEVARSYGARQVIVTRGPSNEDILAALLALGAE